MSTNWRPAGSLVQLLNQVNRAYPARSKASDGMLGDQAHLATISPHNPDLDGVVRALDLTNDPAHGMDTVILARALALSRDPRILTLIAGGRICSSRVRPWSWRPYTGSNLHTTHLHLEVIGGPTADSDRPWALGGSQPVAIASHWPGFPGTVRLGDRTPAVGAFQQRFSDRGWSIVVDSICGTATVRVIRAFQTEKSLDVDGVAGRLTWAALWTAAL